MQDCQTLPADAISAHAVSDKEENVLQQKTNVLQLGCLEYTCHHGCLEYTLNMQALNIPVICFLFGFLGFVFSF